MDEYRLRAHARLSEAIRDLEKQRDTVRGKKTPFRMEYRFPQGTRHYLYFRTKKSAEGFRYVQPDYTLFAQPILRYPLSQQLQAEGPRGGWRKPLRSDRL